MNTLDQLRKKVKKKEEELRNQQELKEREEKELKKIRGEVFGAI
jgi:archaellum component FlaC